MRRTATLSLAAAVCAIAGVADCRGAEERATPPSASPSQVTEQKVEAGSGEPPVPDDEYPLPTPDRRRLLAAVAENRKCVVCHQQEAAEWDLSRHRSSNTNSAYLRSFALEPTPFCRACHAPEGNPRVDAPKEVSEIGVGCVTCHVTRENEVLTGTSSDGKSAPHPVQRIRSFESDEGCGGCHQFRFPTAGGEGDESLMQLTVREHRRSERADSSCASCHMPRQNGRRSHAFASVRDPDWLRQHLLVDAEREANGEIRIQLTQTSGHAFPTGDLFRSLEVGCEQFDDQGIRVDRQMRHLTRHYRLDTMGQRQVVTDDRVAVQPEVIRFSPPADRSQGGRAVWWITYQRVSTAGEGTEPEQVQIESEVPLYGGAL